jgi:ABC-type amino acid transport substrate-binding protein
MEAAGMNRHICFVVTGFCALTWLGGLALSGVAAAQPAATDRLARLRSAKTLRVCIWPDYYGISYRNPKTLELSGMDVDNARALAQELGVAAQFVDSSFARLVDDVTADRCDIAMFAIGITPVREQSLRFTKPHLVSDVYAITTKANRRIRTWADIDTPGTVVAVAKGTLHESVMKEKLKRAELRVLDTPNAREHEVQSGRADVFMTDFPFGRRMVDNSDWARLITPTTAFHLTPYAWAMKPGDDRFHARVERVLATMKADGRLLANARRHGLEPIVVR